MTNEKQHIPAGCKFSPLGPIPEDWEVKRLGEIGDFSKGNGVPKDKIIKDEHGHPCLTYGDLYTKYDFVIKDIKSFIDDVVASESKEIHIGDICFAGSGETPEDIGKCATYIEEKTAFAGGDIIILSPNKGINSIWLSYVLNSDIGGKQRYKSAQGFSIVHIYPDNLKRILIPTPTLKEQQRIVSVLSLWDTAIAKQAQLVEKLTLRKRGLMQQLLTGKKRLKGFEGEWKRSTYSDILAEVKRNLIWDEDELYTLISVRRRSEGLFFRESLYGREIATKNLRPAKTGDFLISKMQIVHGASGLVTEEFDNAKISGSYISLVSKDSEVLDINYFNLWSQTPVFYHQTFVSSFGVHIEKMTFDFDTFMSFGMPLPPIKEQHAIVSLMESINKEIELANKKLARLLEEKKGLMQVLLTGKKRVIK